MRQELRYLSNIINNQEFYQYIYSIGDCLEYKVSNFYLDNKANQYSKTDSGASRFRIRLYEVENFCFGNIELKYSFSTKSNNFLTSKDIWDVSQFWDVIVSLIPSLREKQLLLPDAQSPYRILKPTSKTKKTLDLDGVKWIKTLHYSRLSCSYKMFRITVDSQFNPLIIPPTCVIIEWKGTPDKTIWKTIEEYCLIKPCATFSKFTLLEQYYEHK